MLFENESISSIKLVVEPWAHIYHIKSKEIIEFIEVDPGFDTHVVYYKDKEIYIYCGGKNYNIISNGLMLEPFQDR